MFTVCHSRCPAWSDVTDFPDGRPLPGQLWPGLASRVGPERNVLRGEPAAVCGVGWCRWSAMPGRWRCGGCRRPAA